jgi:hypothetical protein
MLLALVTHKSWMQLQAMIAAEMAAAALTLVLELDLLPPQIALLQVPRQLQQAVAACQPQSLAPYS